MTSGSELFEFLWARRKARGIEVPEEEKRRLLEEDPALTDAELAEVDAELAAYRSEGGQPKGK